jgi:hypothetical protein
VPCLCDHRLLMRHSPSRSPFVKTVKILAARSVRLLSAARRQRNSRPTHAEADKWAPVLKDANITVPVNRKSSPVPRSRCGATDMITNAAVRIGLGVSALILIAGSLLAADPEPRDVLAPTGKLRASLYPGTPTSILDPKETQPRGVGYESRQGAGAAARRFIRAGRVSQECRGAFRPSRPGAWSSASNGTTLQNTAAGSIWPSLNSAS